MNNRQIDMETKLKTIWGASRWPFTDTTKEVLKTDNYTDIISRLEQCIAVHSCGILWGANGIGKSYIVRALNEALPQKSYQVMILTHSSMRGSDIIRYLCRYQGLPVSMRRSDNIITLRNYWTETQNIWPVLIFEEAQNLSAPALEELRLMTCDSKNTQPPFSLLLVGDAVLMDRLRMGVNRPLLSRMGFCLQMNAWSPAECSDYIALRLKEAGIYQNIIEPDAEQLIVQISAGIPRILNHIAQRSFEEAAREQSQKIKTKHINKALNQLPWLATIAVD